MQITVQATINAPIQLVWECFTKPEHITQWNFASTDWICPTASNNIAVNGTFVWRMEAKDGSAGFDFTGTYTEIVTEKLIAYTMPDGRTVSINFTKTDEGIVVSETFDTENIHDVEMQRAGWQAILENFKIYVESKNQK
ncbi:MAG: SRPBCC family protein [Aestuariibaculum sp.]